MAKMGRPKSENAKDKIVALRLTEDEHARLLQYADKYSSKMSDVLKKVWIIFMTTKKNNNKYVAL